VDIVFISDFFASQILGGGELNDDELIKLLQEKNNVVAINSQNITLNFLKTNNKSKFIISNFAGLSIESIKYISDNIHYIVYEHDHKYLPNRNPGVYKNYKAPKNEIINLHFYKNAKAVFCQSKFHKDIVERNLGLANIISAGGNLWSIETLEYLKKLSTKDKKQACSIMDSNIPHKNTKKAVAFCKHKGYEYDLIKSQNYKQFLNRLTDNKKLVFFPETPETLSRIVVEARMSGMDTITTKNIGAIGENWFNMKGKELIYTMQTKRHLIRNKVLDFLE
tara:strand:- start:331 stop:1167 length:837 start_codon:yes stop_codon:yes gene_type:complete